MELTPKQKLTPKQTKFVAEVVSGATLTAAYRAAYDADDMAPESVRVEACRLARSPNVSLAIDEGRRAALDGSAWNRQRAISRMVAVNDAAFAVIQAGDLKAPVVSAFITSWDRLAKVHGIDRHTSDSDQKWSDMVSDMFSDVSVRL